MCISKLNTIILFFAITIICNLNKNIIYKEGYNKQESFTSLSYFKMWYNLAYYITQKESSIAVMRYGDGESSIMHGRSFASRKVDKFHYNGGITKLGEDLNSTLKGNYGKNCYYCIPFYNPQFTELISSIDQKVEYIYTANIFVNYNYNKTKDLLFSLFFDEYKSIILFCNENVNYTSFAEEIIYFPNEIVQWYEYNKNEILLKIKKIARMYNNRLFIVSVGPLSEVLIWNMFNENPHNRYVDFGSSTDELIKHKSTRRYTNYKSSTSRLIDPYFTKKHNSQFYFSFQKKKYQLMIYQKA